MIKKFFSLFFLITMTVNASDRSYTLESLESVNPYILGNEQRENLEQIMKEYVGDLSQAEVDLLTQILNKRDAASLSAVIAIKVPIDITSKGDFRQKIRERFEYVMNNLSKINFNVSCDNTYSVLENAVRSLPLVKFLVEVCGADVNYISLHESTALDTAILFSAQPNPGDAAKVIDYLKSKGAKNFKEIKK